VGQAQREGEQRVFASLLRLRITAVKRVCIVGGRLFTVKLRACSLRVLSESTFERHGDPV